MSKNINQFSPMFQTRKRWLKEQDLFVILCIFAVLAFGLHFTLFEWGTSMLAAFP